MAELYWIRTQEMTNMFSQGYIGMSTISAKKRWQSHKASAKLESKSHLPIYRAFKKHGVGKLVLEVLVRGSSEYVTDLEIKLRPKEGIGWNCAQGGQDPGRGRTHTPESIEKRVAKVRGLKRTEETKMLMSLSSKGVPKSAEHKIKCRIANLGKKRTAEAKKKQSLLMTGKKKITEAGRLKLSEYHKNLPAWKHSKSDKAVWSLAAQAYTFSTKTVIFSQRYLAKEFGLKDSAVSSLYGKLKSGWNPNTDSAYQAWLTEYKKVLNA